MRTVEQQTILLVENGASGVAPEREILERAGYRVVTARTGEEALALCRDTVEIDLVLIDIGLGGGLDGDKTAERILAERRVPFVFLVAPAAAESVENTARVTPFGYVIRNSGAAVLSAAITSAFRLFECKERFRQLFDTIPHGVIHQGADGAIISANPAAERILGLTVDQMQGRTSLDPRWKMIREDGSSVSGEDHPAMIALRTGKTVGPVVRGVFHPEKNEHVWLRITGIPLFDSSKREPYQAYATFEEITVELEAAASLRANETRYRMLFNDIRDAVILVDNNRLITAYNPACMDLFGYDSRELLGRPTRILFRSEEGFQELGRFMRDHADDPDAFIEVEYARKDQTTFVGEKRVQFAYDDAGRVSGFIGIIRDITDRKASEEQIRQLLQEKETLIKEVQHRIKNNMHTMTSLLSLQAKTVDYPAAVQALNDARSRFQGLEVLYDQLYRNESHDAGSLREYLMQLVSRALGVFPNGDNVRTEIDIEDYRCSAKMLSTLGLIVNELTTNAMKYALLDHDDPRLTVRGHGHENGSYTITIADNGPGVPDAFEKDTDLSFGLTMVQALVQQLDGTIRFDCDGGTRVVLTFPT